MEWVFNWKTLGGEFSDVIVGGEENGKDQGRDFEISDYLFDEHTVNLMFQYREWTKEYQKKLSSEEKERIARNFHDAVDLDLKMQNVVDLIRQSLKETYRMLKNLHSDMFNDDNLDKNIEEKRITDEVKNKYEIEENIAEKFFDLKSNLDKYNNRNYKDLSQYQKELVQDISPQLDDFKKLFIKWKELSDKKAKLGKLESRFEEIEQQLRYFEVSTGGYIQQALKTLIKLIDKLPELIYEKRYSLIKDMQPVIQQSNDGISNQQLIRMSISSSEYVNEMPSIAENIVDYLAEENSMNVSIDDVVGENFRTDFSRLIDFVKDIKWNRKKYVKKNGCYGIMIAYDVNKTKKYFSYSGKTDYMGGVNNSKLTCDPNFVALATETRNYLGKEYTWAQLSDETRRYLSVYSTKDNQVSNESSLKDDASTNYTEDELGSAYGCCERKMQAANYNNFNSAKEFYARWAPCYKCIPALILEKGGIRIFALALDHEAWLANPDDSTIKEYKLGAGFIEA